MVDIFGTIGPACEDEQVLLSMFREGMTGIRINLSHVMLEDCRESIERVKNAAAECGVSPKILIDMQGPELRIGAMSEPVMLTEGESFFLGDGGIFVDSAIIGYLEKDIEVLLDDGRILARVVAVNGATACLKVLRGGILRGKKSIAIKDRTTEMPALTANDLKNLALAKEYGITGVMQPFVRTAEDLKYVRKALDENGGKDIRIYAKIENMSGVKNLVSFFAYADEIVIARGDLGNAMPLWELPAIQKRISKTCNEHGMPFMVVTQMLTTMEHSKVPTRAEVSDIYNAVLDGASSVMVTGETAMGDYPSEVIRYLQKTAQTAYGELYGAT